MRVGPPNRGALRREWRIFWEEDPKRLARALGVAGRGVLAAVPATAETIRPTSDFGPAQVTATAICPEIGSRISEFTDGRWDVNDRPAGLGSHRNLRPISGMSAAMESCLRRQSQHKHCTGPYGGNLTIDHGKPTGKGFITTLQNHSERPGTQSFNAPVGYATVTKALSAGRNPQSHSWRY